MIAVPEKGFFEAGSGDGCIKPAFSCNQGSRAVYLASSEIVAILPENLFSLVPR